MTTNKAKAKAKAKAKVKAKAKPKAKAKAKVKAKTKTSVEKVQSESMAQLTSERKVLGEKLKVLRQKEKGEKDQAKDQRKAKKEIRENAKSQKLSLRSLTSEIFVEFADGSDFSIGRLADEIVEAASTLAATVRSFSEVGEVKDTNPSKDATSSLDDEDEDELDNEL